jgi:hypothetical protein
VEFKDSTANFYDIGRDQINNYNIMNVTHATDNVENYPVFVERFREKVDSGGTGVIVLLLLNPERSRRRGRLRRSCRSPSMPS